MINKLLRLNFWIFILCFPPLLAQPTFLGITNLTPIGGYVSQSIVKIDDQNQMYIAGLYTGKMDFDLGPGTYTLSDQGLFIAKYGPWGNFIWAKRFYTSLYNSEIIDIQPDNAGNLIVFGYFEQHITFKPEVINSPSNYSQGLTDLFICKIDPQGDILWSHTLGGQYSDLAKAMDVDNDGNIYTCGEVYNTLDFDPGPGTHTAVPAFKQSGFVEKFNPDGTFAWVLTFPYNNLSTSALNVDDQNNLVFAGRFSNVVDFDASADTFSLSTPVNNYNSFICKYSNQGSFIWAIQTGAVGINSICSDRSCNYYYGGLYANGDLDPGPAVQTFTPQGGTDIYLQKINSAGSLLWTRRFGSSFNDVIKDLSLDGENNLYAIGEIIGSCNFDEGVGNLTLAPFNSSRDIFFNKMDSLSNFVCAGLIGGKYEDYANSVSINNIGEIYFTGKNSSDSVDCDPGPGKEMRWAPATFIARMQCGLFFTGIGEVGQKISLFKVHPVPSQGKLKIEADTKTPYRLKVIGSLGEELFRQTIFESKAEIDLYFLSKGIYFLELNNHAIRETKKIIIE